MADKIREKRWVIKLDSPVSDILQTAIPYDVSEAKRLPGVSPIGEMGWLHKDEAYAGQMARRRAVLGAARADVVAMREDALEAAQELLDMVLSELANIEGFRLDGDDVTCPDGFVFSIDRHDPLTSLGHLVQEDFCILQKHRDEHLMSAAVLCFPASWTLAEKFNQPLTRIHAPVDEYDQTVAARVQRLFDGVQVGRPLWRFNVLRYADAELFQPRTEAGRRPLVNVDMPFLRSERQCILRLPRTNAVVFSIHTYVIRDGN